jgi:hypothetical protein
MACLLPRSCTLSVPSAVTARDPTKSAKSGSGVAPLKPLLTYCPIFRFVRDAITQHNATP